MSKPNHKDIFDQSFYFRNWFNNSFHSFWYNHTWSKWVSYIDGWIPKLAFSIPFFGYLILFNDQIAPHLNFDQLTNNSTSGLKSETRLRFIYFGLIALGVSNLIFKWKKPKAFKFGNNFIKYSKTAYEFFSFSDLLHFHNEIQRLGHRTIKGKYSTQEWDTFIRDAIHDDRMGSKQNPDWEKAKNKHGSLLRDILEDTFVRFDMQKRLILSTCILISTLGYILLLIPSVDLFIKVLNIVFIIKA